MGAVTIRIDSILGGHAKTAYQFGKSEFQSSLGIDPSRPAGTDTVASGILRPTSGIDVSGGVIQKPLVWMVAHPRYASPPVSPVYASDAQGSLYSYNITGYGGPYVLTNIPDTEGEMALAQGNGMAYYNNYIYIAKFLDITRYGPLNGTPKFTKNYWTTTLGKAAMNNPTAGVSQLTTATMNGIPNHVMHRHSDGKLYIADATADNQGAGQLHVIQTSDDGATDLGSKSAVLSFAYGLMITAIESYGSQLVIGLYEGNSQIYGRQTPAKVAFWDTTSGSFNIITWEEFPDSIISKIKNINGVLYFVSGNNLRSGFRVSRYVGGYSFKEIAYQEEGYLPMPGAVDGNTNQLLIGTNTTVPEAAPAVFSIGLQKNISPGLFNIRRGSGAVGVVSLLLAGPFNMNDYVPIVSCTDGNTTNTLDEESANSALAPSVWWSQKYTLASPFQIKRIRIPLVSPIDANCIITPKLYFDGGNKTQTLTVINNTNFSKSEMVANIRTAGDGSNIIMGQHDFFLELRWTGANAATQAVKMPILIELETIPD